MTNKNRDKIALITGVTGQDGSYLSEFLLGKGYVVHGTIRRSSVDFRERIAHLEGTPNFHLHYADMGDSMSILGVIGKVKPTEIYNLAAQSHVQVSFDSPEFTADVDGTYTIRISPVSSTGNGLLFASGSTFTVNVKNGQGSQDLGALDAGKYTATASGEFDYYITEPGSTDFTVFENPNPDSNSTNPDDEPANENETSSNSTTSDDTETPAVDVISGDNQTQPEQMDNAEAKTLPATGNPILVAILAIFISLASFRRRKI